MNLILLQDVEDLGLAGESVHVAPGYGRNYLIPKGLAAPASAVALKQIEAQKEKLEAEGHTIIQKGRKNIRYYVKDYENSLFDLK